MPKWRSLTQRRVRIHRLLFPWPSASLANISVSAFALITSSPAERKSYRPSRRQRLQGWQPASQSELALGYAQWSDALHCAAHPNAGRVPKCCILPWLRSSPTRASSWVTFIKTAQEGSYTRQVQWFCLLYNIGSDDPSSVPADRERLWELLSTFVWANRQMDSVITYNLWSQWTGLANIFVYCPGLRSYGQSLWSNCSHKVRQILLLK